MKNFNYVFDTLTLIEDFDTQVVTYLCMAIVFLIPHDRYSLQSDLEPVLKILIVAYLCVLNGYYLEVKPIDSSLLDVCHNQKKVIWNILATFNVEFQGHRDVDIFISKRATCI